MAAKEQTQNTDKAGAKQKSPTPAVDVDGQTQQEAPLEGLVQRARFEPRSLTPRDVLQLQHIGGNQAVAQLLAGANPNSMIQTKLTVGAAGDKYEQEADRVASQVMRMPAPAASIAQRRGEEDEIQAKPLAASVTPLIQRAAEEDELQAKSIADNRSFTPGEDFEGSLASARGGGTPLPKTTRDFMEQRIGADFSSVKVHTDTQSDQLNRSIQAKAFTTGSDMFFRQGAYDPNSQGGKELIAHELTHVVQQGAADIKGPSLQRHPSHAEEQEVQPQRIQRHPSHAEEQKVQAKRDPGASSSTIRVLADPTLASGKRIQRLTVGKDDKDQPIIISVSDAIKKLAADYKFIDTKILKKEVTTFHQSNKVFDSWGELDAELRGKGHLLKHQDKKIRMEAKYGIPIGGESGIEQFGEKMLETLDGLFSHLPPSHLNALKGLTRQKEDSVSFYDPNNQTLTISYAQPAWLYSWGKKNTKAFGKDARKLMEEAALPHMLAGSGYVRKNPDGTIEDHKKRDASLGLDSSQRSTISYSGDDPLAKTKIVEWTVLHEMGHAVDERIKWTTRNGGKPEFGGWKTHGEREDTQAQEDIADAYLKNTGLSLAALEKISVSYDEQINKTIATYTKAKKHYENLIAKGTSVETNTQQLSQKEQHIKDEQAKLGKHKTGKEVFMAVFLGTDVSVKEKAAAEIASGFPAETRVEAEEKIKQALTKIVYTQTVPWQFPDGLASKLEADGRIYQLDHYKTWVSYLAAARQNILSPYQFSSPGEWIAEAYAAFYGTNDAARNLLTAGTKAKIAKELGEPPRRGVSEAGRAKGSFEGSSKGKAVLNEPKDESVKVLSIKESAEDYPISEFEKESELIVGGPPSTSPLKEALSKDLH